MDKPLVEPNKLILNLRALVLEKATAPTLNYPDHQLNKQRFKNLLDSLLLNCSYNPTMSLEKVWFHFWSKIRYGGIKAKIASAEIARIESSHCWNSPSNLTTQEWEFNIHEWQQIRKQYKNRFQKQWKEKLPDYEEHLNMGRESYLLMARKRNYLTTAIIGNEYKLDKTVKIGRAFSEWIANNPDTPPLYFLSGEVPFDNTSEHFWEIHRRLKSYVGNITAFHILMDLGFPCVKPDRKLVFMLANLGFLNTLSPGASQKEINKVYLREDVWTEVINVSIFISNQITNSINPIRELDLLLVKYSQDPEEECGITVNLEKEYGLNYLVDRCKN